MNIKEWLTLVYFYLVPKEKNLKKVKAEKLAKGKVKAKLKQPCCGENRLIHFLHF